VESATGKTIEIPSSLESIMKAKKKSVIIDAEYSSLKDYLIRN
jgi:hypothetical protein